MFKTKFPENPHLLSLTSFSLSRLSSVSETGTLRFPSPNENLELSNQINSLQSIRRYFHLWGLILKISSSRKISSSYPSMLNMKCQTKFRSEWGLDVPEDQGGEGEEEEQCVPGPVMAQPQHCNWAQTSSSHFYTVRPPPSLQGVTLHPTLSHCFTRFVCLWMNVFWWKVSRYCIFSRE